MHGDLQLSPVLQRTLRPPPLHHLTSLKLRYSIFHLGPRLIAAKSLPQSSSTQFGCAMLVVGTALMTEP